MHVLGTPHITFLVQVAAMALKEQLTACKPQACWFKQNVFIHRNHKLNRKHKSLLVSSRSFHCIFILFIFFHFFFRLNQGSPTLGAFGQKRTQENFNDFFLIIHNMHKMKKKKK